MNIKKRMQIISLINRMEKNIAYAKKLGLKDTSTFRGVPVMQKG